MTAPTRPPLRSAFIDTGAYYALVDPTDGRHAGAVAILRQLTRDHTRLSTTNFVRAEAHALILNRAGHALALDFLHRLSQGATTLVRVTEADERRALELIERYQDKDFSLTDATCFVVIERLGIEAAFTFDGNFVQYGLRVLEP